MPLPSTTAELGLNLDLVDPLAENLRSPRPDKDFKASPCVGFRVEDDEAEADSLTVVHPLTPEVPRVSLDLRHHERLKHLVAM